MRMRRVFVFLLFSLNVVPLLAWGEYSPHKDDTYIVPLAIGGTILAIICIIGAYLIIRRVKLKRNAHAKIFQKKGNVKSIDGDQMLHNQIDLLPYDKTFEFPRKKLKLRRRIGISTFGTCYKASALGIEGDEGKTIVAAKIIKKSDDVEIKRIFAHELKVMTNLGRHLNICNLLGAITKNAIKHELTAIVDYCPFGNMQSFLVRHRPFFINQIIHDQDMIDPTITLSRQRRECFNPFSANNNINEDQRECSTVINIQNSNNGEQMVIEQTDGNNTQNNNTSSNLDYPTSSRSITHTVTTTDLLCWSFQIARAMQFLTSRNVLHGNLAARNVLLCEGNVVKITDFGVERSVFKTNVYLEKRQDPMPFKWFAPECTANLAFTSSSDVWSFGIVVWELFSLGAVPYPGNDNFVELQHKIEEGFRLDKPPFATQKIYRDLMLSCWRLNPELRPSFCDLEDGIYKLLERNIANQFISMNDSYMEWNSRHFNPAQTDYLKLVKSPEIPKHSSAYERINIAENTFSDVLMPKFCLGNRDTSKDFSTGYVTMQPTMQNDVNKFQHANYVLPSNSDYV